MPVGLFVEGNSASHTGDEYFPGGGASNGVGNHLVREWVIWGGDLDTEWERKQQSGLIWGHSGLQLGTLHVCVGFGLASIWVVHMTSLFRHLGMSFFLLLATWVAFGA